MAQTEVTDRFPTSKSEQSEIARRGSDKAAEVFARLCRGMAPGQALVATWDKPQFTNGRSLRVNSPAGLSYVMAGYLDGGCRHLRLFHQTNPPQGDRTYRDLFLP